jgi:ubiquinone biosynthesis protein COQ9
MTVDPMQDIKDKLIMAVLPEIPFSGWTRSALGDAAVSIGMDRTMAERAFPGGPVAAALHFADLADRQLAREAETADLGKKGMTTRIKWLVRRRIEAWEEHREAVRRAISLFSMPNVSARAAQAAWRTADLIWYLAGDNSVDFSYYTKRFSLSGVYSATLMVWLSDTSEGSAESWDFLDRRAAELAKVPKLVNQGKDMAKRLMSSKMLNIRHFGVKGVKRT